jgi:hypothetical protein
MQKRALQFFQDSWASIGVFVGAAVMAIDTASQLYSTGAVSLSTALLIGLGLFVFFGIATIFKYARKATDAERKYEELKNSAALSGVNSANSGGIAIQQADNSPVIQATSGGFASAGNIHLTQNFFPSKKIESISFATVDGKINIRHNSPKLDTGGSELDFKFTIINETDKDFPKCAVYIDEISYKQKEDGEWEISNDLPSSRPVKWDILFVDLEGKTDIGSGDRKSFILSNVQTRIHTRNKVVYQYPLLFHKETTSLPNEKAIFHRLLMRFHGGQYFGAGINKKFYIYIKEAGGKKYAGIEELAE